ncbi:MAG TPA: hypothetical protein VGG33_21730 [Polyangia bacterium]
MPTLLFGVLVGLWAGANAAPAGALVQALAPAAGSSQATTPRAAGNPGRSNANVTPPAPAPSPPAPARDPETVRILAEARMHFDAGQDHYANQRYQDAIRSFQAGYALVPRPNFLVNIGQAYRKLGNLVRAKEAYVAYVRALPENSALRDQALTVLAEIEVQLHEGQPDAVGRPPTANPPVTLPPVALDEPARRHSTAATWLGAAFGGAGVGLIAAGAGFQWRAKTASDSLALSSQRGDEFDINEERAGKRAERYGNRLFIAGGAMMVTGLVLFFVIDGIGDEPTTLLKRGDGASLALSPDHVGLSWRF